MQHFPNIFGLELLFAKCHFAKHRALNIDDSYFFSQDILHNPSTCAPGLNSSMKPPLQPTVISVLILLLQLSGLWTKANKQ